MYVVSATQLEIGYLTMKIFGCLIFQWISVSFLNIGHQSSSFSNVMTTSSNGNIFRVTGHLCGEFTGPQRPVARSCDVFYGLRLNTRLSKQSWGWRFETPSRPLWRHCNGAPRWHALVALLCFSRWFPLSFTPRGGYAEQHVALYPRMLRGGPLQTQTMSP